MLAQPAPSAPAQTAPSPSAPAPASSVAGDASEPRQRALDALENMIRFAASTERRAGMRKVIALNEQERQRFYPVLEEMASKDLDFAVRETAIRVLGEMRHRSSQAVFIAALRDENRDVIRAAVAALSHDPPAEAGAALEELARKEEYAENNQLLVSVINLLGELKRREMASFFKEKSDDPRTHSEIRLAITLFYGRAGAVEMKDHLLGVLRNEQLDPTTRSFAANALGRLGDRSVASPIREELNKIRALSNSRERAALSSFKLQLLGALVRLGDEEVNAEILAAARDDDGRVRLRAVRQIGEIRLQAARPLLEYIAANDSGPRIRAAARAAIKRLDGATGEDESDRDAPETSENSSASGAEGAP